MSAAPPAGSGRAEPGGGRARPRVVAILFGLALFLLVADQLLKDVALAGLEDRDEPVRLLGGAVYLTLVRNSGAAWSIGSGYTWVFPMITTGVVAWICWMALRLRSLPWAISLGLVLGGALGNLGDRIFRAPGHFVGHVVDMVSLFDPYGRIIPVFNLADSSLVCGVILAVLLELTGRQRDGTRLADDKDPDADGVTASSPDDPAEQRERA
ncbi:signal peptidase II [Micromonospora rosaria]|uniref:Lipoprotein signal peptidase n=1 Tax=Micromonospora rosaria TaxID=47874 RepID=A0A136PSI5_9ACTN|nr:signal peptidase II [Micromonospora rosaria]KXK61378.1 signal peptidase II [Micromonospora rosaria]